MSVTAAPGFVAAGAHGGLKAAPALDLALVATEHGRAVPTAGVFTANRMVAAPVTVTRGHLSATRGQAAVVLVNSGNANAGTGQQGCADAEHLCSLVAAELGCDHRAALMCSTGLIGSRLPVEVMSEAIPGLVGGRSTDAGATAAEAILTTDTVAKESVAGGPGFVVGGMAKGAAMLAPHLATMLAVITTDAVADRAVLQRALQTAADQSFNTLTVDGATSTNDTVLLMAGGQGEPTPEAALTGAVTAVCCDLAEQMAFDAEGATKVVRIQVVGATDDDDAARAARRVAESQLTKCSWYGEDPYWGRVASDLGSSGARFDATIVSIAYGGVTVAAGGVGVDHDRAAVSRHMAERSIEITADLGLGAGRATVLTNDLTHGYVDENMGPS